MKKYHDLKTVVINHISINYFYTREKNDVNGNPRYRVFILDPDAPAVIEKTVKTYCIETWVKIFWRQKMNYRKFVIDNKEIVFVNHWRGNRSGFVHETELYIDGRKTSAARCQYYNRTWESYEYQSVMLSAVYSARERITERERVHFMDVNGYKRLTAARKAAFLESIESNESIKFYNKIPEALR